jgi:hypothetical protein
MRQHPIGHTVEAQLCAALDALLDGSVGLHELTPSLAGFYTVGHWHGSRSRDLELARVADERDALYERLYNPGMRLTEVRQRRIDQAIDAAFEAGSLIDDYAIAAVMVEAARAPRRPR